MTGDVHHFAVKVAGERVGCLSWRDHSSWFAVDDDYYTRTPRRILSWSFEDHPGEHLSARDVLPPYFSNLLPERGSQLRSWIARESGVAETSEAQLLAHIGHDLPGAITIAPDDGTRSVAPTDIAHPEFDDPTIRFSLAGLGLKFSRLLDGERFTAPAHGDHGDWICKLPDPRHPHLPRHEHATSLLARRVGIDVPDVRLVPRDDIDVPAHVWPDTEDCAFAIRRFDRGPNRSLVHAEDFAQVRSYYPENKYRGTFEAIGKIAALGGEASLVEFARRLTFYILIGNDDAHLKNWSLLYTNPDRPHLAPAYDIVATENYLKLPDYPSSGLRLGGERHPSKMNVQAFSRLGAKLGVEALLRDTAEATIDATLTVVADSGDLFAGLTDHYRAITERVHARSRSLRA